VPFFFKQWGGVRKSVAGRKLEGKTYDQFPERVEHPILDAERRFALAELIEAPFRVGNLINITLPESRRFAAAT
jgi:hypothetical protein